MTPSQMNMKLNEYERTEWVRADKALYARGANAQARLLSACVAKGDVPLAQFDRAGQVYRAWLVFDEPKA